MSTLYPRDVIRQLLNPKKVNDAMAYYYAFHHPPEKNQITTLPASGGISAGYVAVSQTSFDLFRPFVTLRMPLLAGAHQPHPEQSVELIYKALTPELPVNIYADEAIMPLLRNFFDIHSERRLRLFQLLPANFIPIVNLFTIQKTAPNGLSKYLIRHPAGDPDGTLLASAGVNWQSPHFADIAVYTNPQYRRKGYGKSAVAALSQQLLSENRIPLYTVIHDNAPSIELAKSVNFSDTRLKKNLLEATLKPRPPNTLK